MMRIGSWRAFLLAIWFMFSAVYFSHTTLQTSRHAVESRSSESCETSPVQTNVTLRGGIKAGYFHKLAQYVAMKLCVQLCCQEKGCDVAFMIGKNCYGVTCFSEDLCSVVPAKNAPKALMISKVDFRGEVYLEQFMPKKLRCFETSVEHNVTLRGGLSAGNFTAVGHAESIDACARFCCVNDNCDLAMLVNDNCFMVTCTSVDQCRSIRTNNSIFETSIARVNKTKETTKDQQTVLALSSLPGQSSKLMCKNGIVQYNQTLLGGYEAGKFKTLARSTNMSTCIRLCCGEKSCDVALMIEKKCYGVACHNLKQCRAIPAKNSVMLSHLNPRISYITSRNEEVTSIMLRRQSEICTSNVISYDVTLRDRKHAGKYKTFGEVENMHECIRICCMEQHCDVAFMISGICFTVRCYSDDSCKEVHAPGTGYKPMLSYVVREKPVRHKTRRRHRKHKKHKKTRVYNRRKDHHSPNTTLSPDIPRVPSPNLPSVDSEHYCTNSEIMYNVTLQGGINAGKYRDRGVLPNMQECLRICCIATTCDLAFMIGNHCLSVTCKNQSLCEVVTARSSAYKPRIAYIYARSTNTNGTLGKVQDDDYMEHDVKKPSLGNKNTSLLKNENKFRNKQTDYQKKKSTRNGQTTKLGHGCHHRNKENLLIKKDAMKKLKQNSLSANKFPVSQTTTETKITEVFRTNLTHLVHALQNNNNNMTSDKNSSFQSTLPTVESTLPAVSRGNYTNSMNFEHKMNTSKQMLPFAKEVNTKYLSEDEIHTSKKQKIALKNMVDEINSHLRKEPGGRVNISEDKLSTKNTGVNSTLNSSMHSKDMETQLNHSATDMLGNKTSSYRYRWPNGYILNSFSRNFDSVPERNKNTTLRLMNSSAQVSNTSSNGLRGTEMKDKHGEEMTNGVQTVVSNNTDLVLQDAFTFESEGNPTTNTLSAGDIIHSGAPISEPSTALEFKTFESEGNPTINTSATSDTDTPTASAPSPTAPSKFKTKKTNNLITQWSRPAKTTKLHATPLSKPNSGTEIEDKVKTAKIMLKSDTKRTKNINRNESLSENKD